MDVKMSSVKSIQPNYQPKVILAKKTPAKSKLANNPSFGSEMPNDEVIKAFRKGLKGPVASIAEFLNDNDGEVQAQLLNALFTTTLAPFMIAFNPFSKEDSKTKKYTAARQPISAVIAIAGGVGLTIPINNFVSKLGSEGYIKFLDMRMAPDKDYLKNGFNKEYKEAVKNNTLDKMRDKYFTNKSEIDNEHLAPKTILQKFMSKQKLKQAYNKVRKDEVKDFYTQLISLDTDNIKFKNGHVVLENGKGKILKNEKGIEYKRIIPNITKKEELEAYLNEININKRSFGNLMKEVFNVEFFSDGKLKSHGIDEKLSGIKAKDFLEKTGLVEKVNIEGFLASIAKLRQNETAAKELEQTLTETLVKMNKNGALAHETWIKEFLTKTSPNMAKKEVKNLTQKISEVINVSTSKDKSLMNDLSKKILTIIGKDNNRNLQNTVGEDLINAQNMTLKQLMERLGLYEKTDKVTLQSLMDSKVKETLDKFATKLKKAGIEELKDFDPKAQPLKFAKGIMSDKIKRLESFFKTFTKYNGIFTNLVIVSITCTVLNWAYPRIVEKIRPEWVKKDDPNKTPNTVGKGGNK